MLSVDNYRQGVLEKGQIERRSSSIPVDDEHIELYRFCPNGSGKTKNTVLVLPNGYGMLAYAYTLCDVVAANGYNVFALNFRGQGTTRGKLSIKNGMRDLEVLLKNNNDLRGNGQITVIANCIAMLPLLELTEYKDFWSHIRRVILYSYLAKPSDHATRFIRKAQSYGVRFKDEFLDGNCNTPQFYAKLPVPLVLVHPLIKSNRLRATDAQLDELKRVAPLEAVYQPKYGYNISNYTQIPVVSRVVEEFFLRHIG